MPTQTKGNHRIAWATAIAALVFVATAASQAKLQLFERDSTLRLAMKSQKYMISRTDYAKRGSILTSDGRPLAEDGDTSQLGLEFSHLPRTPGFFMELSEATGIPATEMMQAADSGLTSREWTSPLSAAQTKQVGIVKSRWHADGISLLHGGIRAYPFGAEAASMVGLMGGKKVGVGLELALNSQLAGTDGKIVGLIDGTGAILPMRLGKETRVRKDGKTITLTIDSALQELVAEALREEVLASHAENGTAIVSNPKTGDILALANYPSFDPNGSGKADPDEPTSELDVAVSAKLEPGSMFKILTLAKALDDPKFSPSATIDCRGETTVGNPLWRVVCDEHRAHNTVNAQQAIARSCNISAAHWSIGIGYGPFLQYVRDLGLLSKTGVGLPFEIPGHVDPNEYAKRLQLANMGFGQSISATPLGLSSAFSMLANHGVQMKPRLIEKVGDVENPIVTLGQRVKPESADTVLRYMETVIESPEGTGHALHIPGYRLAGKTGTAQKVGDKKHGHVSNFVGFVPAQNPQVEILVMVNRPQGPLYHGSAVAGPVFQKIARGVIQQYHIPPTEPIPSKR